MRKCAADNLMFLRSDYKNIYEQFRCTSMDTTKIAIESTKSGDPNIVVLNEGANARLYSQYDPIVEASKWMDQSEHQVEEHEHILIFGLGLGYHAEELARRYPHKKIYLYEPDPEVFKGYIEARDMRPLLNQSNIAALAVGNEEHVIYNLVHIIAKHAVNGFSFLVTPAYQRYYHAQLSAFRETAEKTIRNYHSNFATFNYFQEEWPQNIIRNFPYAIRTPDIRELKDQCSGIPALIVGSGPSLEADIEMIKSLQNRCMIIAAGTSVQALTHHGITPDLVVSVDGGLVNYNAFEHIDLEQIPLLYSSVVHYKIVEKPRKSSLYVKIDLDTMANYLFPEEENRPVFISTASVTGTAIQAANYLGCSPVLFTGQDLSYPNDSYYAAGVEHITKEIREKTVADATEEVINVSGGVNKSTKKMNHTRQDIEDLIRLTPGQTYINCSRYGAVIKGTSFILLHQWVQSFSFKHHLEPGWFKRKIDGIEWDIQRSISSGTAKLLKLKADLAKYRDEIQHLLSLLEKINKSDEMKAKNRYSKSLQKIDLLWNGLSSSPLFQTIYALPISAQLMIFTRYLPTIAQEVNEKKKAELLGTHLGRLVAYMSHLTDNMIRWTDESIRTNDRLSGKITSRLEETV
ncbi:SAM-dependent methyltransferase [Paenibacillus sp. 32O-W]|nr:SAM-dependent methyltransferase [Paenibacillus sp. 32O-W]